MLNRASIVALQTGSGLARVRSLPLSLLTGALGWVASTDAHVFTKVDADTAFTAYNDTFYFTQGTNSCFCATTAGGKTWFWERAEQMEILLDVYERTTNATCLTSADNLSWSCSRQRTPRGVQQLGGHPAGRAADGVG